MKPNHFAGLAATALAALIITVLVYSANAPWTPTTAGGEKLAPTLAGDVDKIAAVEISQGTQKINISRDGEAWVLKDRDGFPASSDKVRTLLIGLAEGTLREAKTRNKSRFHLLNVDDPAGKNSNARLIRLLDDKGNTLTEIIAGKSSTNQLNGQQGTYVRRPDEDQAWLASKALSGGIALRDWTQPRVFETATEKIADATIEIPGEPSYHLKRQDTQHVLENIPAGKKIKYINIVDNIIEAASFLDFDDVRKAAPATPDKNAGKITMNIDPGLTIALNIKRDDGGTWAALDVSGKDNAKDAAEKLKARVAGWEFKILPSKANTILKKQADLLEDAAS